MGKQKLSSNVNVEKTIPVFFTIEAAENKEIVKWLDQAIIAENTDVINISVAEQKVAAFAKNIKGMYYLSPTKILIVFDCKIEASIAVSEESYLWDVFDDIRMWFEGEVFDDRLVWIDCYGIHPKCWSTDNVRKIGEKWGPILYIENRVNNLYSLTFARMLIRTKAQNKIDGRIRILFENGSCDVWVKEDPCCCKKNPEIQCAKQDESFLGCS